MAWWCGPGMADCRDCHVRSCSHCHPWSGAAKAQVNAANRTSDRVESESKVRVPHRRANDGEAAHSSTRPRGA